MPRTVDDPRQRKPDISTAKNCIGWKPQVRLRVCLPIRCGMINGMLQVPMGIGLSKTIEYFRQELHRIGEVVPTGPFASPPRGLNDPQ